MKFDTNKRGIIENPQFYWDNLLNYEKLKLRESIGLGLIKLLIACVDKASTASE